MTIGIFVDGDFIPSYSGAKNRMHYLSRYLQKIGLKIIIFHSYRGWSNLNMISEEPFKTYILPINRYYNDLDFIANLINKENVHIIQFCDLESTISQGVRLSQYTNAYLISELHYVVSRLTKNLGGLPERIRSIRHLELITGKVADHIICLTDNDNLELRHKMNVAQNRISTIPSGVDLNEIKYHGPNFKTKTILFLGNLYFEPNADAVRLIHHYIYPILYRRGFKIIITGDCPPKLKKEFQSLNLVFTGPVNNLDKVFRQSTIALAPIREGTGLRIKILNYLAAGLPIIATSAAASDIQKTNKIIIENDFRKYPKIIIDLLDNPQHMSRLAREGRELIEHNFDWLTIARQTAAVYRNIITKKRKNKSCFINLIAKLKIGKPDWLEEFEHKERFKKFNSKIRGDFSYGIIHRGKIKIFRNR